MGKTRLVLLLFAFLIANDAAAENLPEVIGFDAANEAAAQIFSSPALPSLDNERASLSPVGGIVTMEGVDETGRLSNGEEFPITNKGEIKGEVAGLTFNYSGGGDLGFFATAAWSRVGGDITSSYLGTTKVIRDISAQSHIGTLGVSYRAVGTATSFFALGVFAGPAFVNAKTSARIVHSDGTATRIRLDPETTAVYLGFQMMLRPGEFRINPYFNLLANTNFGCFKPVYEGDPYPGDQFTLCQNGQRGVTAVAALAGVGVNVGYGRFQFGLLHTAAANPTFKTTPLVFSLRIGI